MNKREFFNAIDWDARLSWDFIKKLYGYSLYDQEFLVAVLAEYEKRGRNRVKYAYRFWVNLHEWQQGKELRPVAREIAKQIDEDYKRKVKEWKKRQEKMTKGQVARQILNW